ncbi:MAG: hypothetical protein GYB36_12620 [Alphaproteobacteria bacterium]|nr:hypothetical protein [Alphaproteobacteria bacterium]
MFVQYLNGISRATIAPALLFASITSACAQDREAFTPEELRSDFTSLYASMQGAHYDLFVNTPQSVMDQQFDELLRGIDRPMSRFEAAIYFQTFLSQSRISHSRIDFPVADWFEFRDEGGGALPIDVRIRDGRVLVETHQAPGLGIERGDEVLSLNGEPNALWLGRMTRHLSAETPDMAYALLESYLPVLFWVEYPDAESVDLTIQREDGSRHDLTLPLITREEMDALPEPEITAFTLPMFDSRMLDDAIAYLRPGPFYNTDPGGNIWDPTSYIARVDAAFEAANEADAQAMIIDLRDNPGGNNTFSDPIIAWFADEPWTFASEFRIRVSEETTASNQARLDTLAEGEGGVSAIYAEIFANAENGETVSFDLPIAEPHTDRRFNAPVYLLINRYSYSNSVTTAAIVQDYGFGQVAGEMTTDMATTYGAMETFNLPITGIIAGFPKAHIIRPNGETSVHPVTPDIELAFPPLRGSEDVVLEDLRQRIAERLE